MGGIAHMQKISFVACGYVSAKQWRSLSGSGCPWYMEKAWR